MRIGVLCPSEIAIRRFMPALIQVDSAEYAGVGVNSAYERYGDHMPSMDVVNRMLAEENGKADAFLESYGGVKYESYDDVVSAPEIDAVYIPLPPALHYPWARKALEHGKHVLVEKPSTTSLENTRRLVELADSNGLALHENYMFMFHDQLDAIDSIVRSGEVGEVRLYRISFGFPRRDADDFRYDKALGGGALIDAGGYTIKYAMRLLGKTAQIRYAQLGYTDEFDVDMYGSAALVSQDGVTAQVAFGMDNDYRCDLDVWGSKGTLRTGRVLTAPAGFTPTVTIKRGNETVDRALPEDDSFRKSILHFIECVGNERLRKANHEDILEQAKLLSRFMDLASC